MNLKRITTCLSFIFFSSSYFSRIHRELKVIQLVALSELISIDGGSRSRKNTFLRSLFFHSVLEINLADDIH